MTSAGASREPESFWDFSLRTYATAGVSGACLELQDQQGADVNMVLYCCWAGDRAQPLSEAAFQSALDFSLQWGEQVVRPLRSVRRWMKQEVGSHSLVVAKSSLELRERIKELELAAEKLQQHGLEALPLEVDDAGGLHAVAANLRQYFASLGVEISPGVEARLGMIVRAGFPGKGKPAFQAFSLELVE